MKAKPRVVLYSILALISLVLTYLVHWLFILPVAVLIYLNQKDLLGN